MFRRCLFVVPALFLIFVLPAFGQETPVDYTNHQVVRFHFQTPEQLEQVRGLGAQLFSDYEGVGQVDYIMPPGGTEAAAALGIPLKVLVPDLQKVVDAERRAIEAAGVPDTRDPAWFTNFKTLAQIDAKLDQMAADRPEIATVFSIGNSYENRPIRGIRITGPGTGKPAVLFDATHHAREWITPMVAMWIADQLVYGYDSNPEIQALLNEIEVIVIPVENPDGYVHTWTVSRYWRKTRRPFGSCYGVDMNRNFATGWGGQGSSSDPCSDLYRGPAAFSEPETQRIRDFIQANPQIVSGINFHSYGLLLMSPYGYTSALPPDHPTFMELNQAMHDEILAVHGLSYTYGPIYSTIYPASGGSVDWCYASEGMFSFTIELRGSDFVLPASEIIPNSEEIFAGAWYLMHWSASPVKISFPNGRPSRLEPEVATALTVGVRAIGAELDPDSPTLYARLGGAGEFTGYPLISLGDDRYYVMLPAVPCDDTLEYYVSAASTGGDVATAPTGAPANFFSVSAPPVVVLLDENMDTNPGWGAQGQWAWGMPTGGGSNNHDPNGGHTGPYVYGYNLAGDYSNNMPVYSLTTPPIDCTGFSQVNLSFWRWLGVESNSNYDKATVDISTNGTTWIPIWEAVDTGGAVSDATWVEMNFDISAYANNQPNVRLRWTMGPTDVYVTYPGWNVDDVIVWAPDPAGCPFTLGDTNCDGAVNALDINPFVIAMTNPDAYHLQYPLCQIGAADVNEDGEINALDINPFVRLLTR